MADLRGDMITHHKLLEVSSHVFNKKKQTYKENIIEHSLHEKIFLFRRLIP
jgi:hypothetical protein